MYRVLALIALMGLFHQGTALQQVFESLTRTESCSAVKLRKPNNVAQVRKIVQRAFNRRQKVKVVGTRHAFTDINCGSGVVLDLSNMDKISVDPEKMQATVQAGATHEALLNKLRERGFAVIHPAMKFTGLSVGGTIAAGAHGSSLVHPATLSDQVVSMTMVDGRGRIRKITGKNLRATNVNIGMLGVMTDVTIKIVPQYKVRLEFTDHEESILFNGQAVEWAKQQDYFEMSWYPSTNRVVVFNGTYLDNASPGDDRVKFVFTAPPSFLGELNQASADRNTPFFCGSEAASREALLFGTGGVTQAFNAKGEFANPVTGPMQDILVTYCAPGTCAWDQPGIILLPIIMEFAFDLDTFPSALRRVREILDKRPWCTFAAEGIQIRFVRKSNNYLSQSAGQDVGVFEIVSALRQERNASHYGMATMQEIYQTMMLEFKGRPHWGKNGRSAFADPFPTVEELYPDWDSFLRVKKKMDPVGMFENDFYKRMTRQKKLKKFRYCAVDDKCICSKDRHCADDQKCTKLVIGGVKTGICEDNTS